MISAPPRRLLINCSNLHVGGGVAVASSFINILSHKTDPRFEISLLLSTAVHATLIALGADLDRFAKVEVLDYRGMRSLWQGLGRRFADHDTVFTVFGPAYAIARGRRHVCGFAQPLIIYPNNPAEHWVPLLDRIRRRLTCWLQQWFFARADELVVELEHVKLALSRKRLFRRMPVHVVYNTVDAIFKEPARWAPVSLPARSPAIRLGVVARNYVHKNLARLPELKRALRSSYGLAVEFLVTFTDDEWQACRADFRREIHNVGALVLPQCPTFYSALDGVIFPSVLECFSAVPLEAMSMGKPLFASDLPFIRDCCHEHALYFDPLRVESMAASIAAYFRLDEATRADGIARARAFVQGFPGPHERAESYLQIAWNALGAAPLPLPR